MLLQAEKMHKMTSISLKMVKVFILSENSCHFVSCSPCNNSYFLLDISHVLDGTTPENQHRNRGPMSKNEAPQAPKFLNLIPLLHTVMNTTTSFFSEKKYSMHWRLQFCLELNLKAMRS